MKKVEGLILIFILTFFFVQDVYTQTTPSPKMLAANKLMNQGKWAEAESAFANIVKTEPQNGRAWYFLGLSRHSQEKFVTAIKAFEKSLGVSNTPITMYRIAAGYSRLKNVDKAFEWLNKAISNANFRPNIATNKDFEILKSDVRFNEIEKTIHRRRNPCTYSKESRQFDFWIGHWEVFSRNGRKVGENIIKLDTQDCVLVENWKNTGGGLGKSLNVYNPSLNKWQQFYVFGSGAVILFEGEYKKEDKIMHFTAKTTRPNGTKVMHIFEFHDLPNKTVRQLWKQSIDGGKTWNTSWDTIYKKKKRKNN